MQSILKSAHTAISDQLANNVCQNTCWRGVQGLDLVSGAQFTEQVISSPWNLCLVSSDLIAGASSLEESDRDVLLIAMAVVHQIWALFLNKTTWWKVQ
jgi:hypothetical protein